MNERRRRCETALKVFATLPQEFRVRHSVTDKSGTLHIFVDHRNKRIANYWPTNGRLTVSGSSRIEHSPAKAIASILGATVSDRSRRLVACGPRESESGDLFPEIDQDGLTQASDPSGVAPWEGEDDPTIAEMRQRLSVIRPPE